MPRTRLTLYDYSDRELLLMMRDHGNGDGGWVNSADLAEALQIEAKHPGQHVGVRLGWLRRFGAVERREVKGESFWRPTRMGEALASGNLNNQQSKALEGLDVEQLLITTRILTQRYNRAGDTAAHLMRREWQAGTFGRRPTFKRK